MDQPEEGRFPMELEKEYILTIARCGSFSKAAEALHMTQPALSIAIRKVETRLGMPLFNRKKHPLQLTEAGAVYVRGLREIKKVEETVDQQLKDLADLVIGNLRIGGSHYLNAHILPPLLTRFSAAYPGIQIDLLESSSAHLASLLKERELDLTFSCNPEFIPAFKHYSIFHDTILLAVPADHPFHEQYGPWQLSAAQVAAGRHLESACPGLPLAALSALDYIVLRPGNNLHDRVAEIFRAASCTPWIKTQVSQLATVYHLAKAGYASAFICDRLVDPHDRKLVFYKIDLPVTDREFFLLLPQEEYTPRAVRAFIRFCREHPLLP